MTPRFLRAHDPLDRDALAHFLAQTLPGARVERDSAALGSVHAYLTFGGLAIHLEAGKANTPRGPRVPWMTAAVALPTHGLEIDWVREFNARAYQVPVVREGAFIGTGGPAELVAATFDPGIRAALGALASADALDRVEIRNDRVVLHLNGWPADAATSSFVLETAHAIASRVGHGVGAFLASGRAIDGDATLAAYRAGLGRSAQIGKLILLGLLVLLLAIVGFAILVIVLIG
ncbi:MAG: hypothetical protein IT376_21620 [Polyangiaceae bacterium]|nr:hypothetical protein [Polyangiaceae bacterium]